MDKIINKSIDKLKTKPKKDFTANYDYDDDDKSISVLDKTEYDYNDINSKIREQNYKFDNDDEILNSFSKTSKISKSIYISLTSMIFYNYFENKSDKFKLIIKNKTQSHTINFKNGSYYVSDISKIIDDEIKNNFNDISEKEKYVQIVVDVNRYAILVVIKENWVLELDNNFVELF